MKLQPIEELAVHYEPSVRERVRVGRLARKNREILFEYDTAFLASGLELSPFHLPLRPGVAVGPALPFDGLFGVFDDSLPDGWGRLLIDRRAAQLGISATTLTPLERLSLVGARSMGALTYAPETPLDEPTTVALSAIAAETERVFAGTKARDLDSLIALGGSPKGARPKVLVQLAPNGDILQGAREILPGHTAWLVKFHTPGDDRHAGPIEHAYFLMAAAAGIDVPRTQLLGGTRRKPGYFAIERFDRSEKGRVHMHTVGGLLQLPLTYSALDYTDVLKLARRLTRDETAVAEMFRRACFNVLAHNRDDHSRNFAFLMSRSGEWTLSPAYDLTFTDGPGGEHTTLVAGEGKSPTVEHLLRVADAADLTAKVAARALARVREAVLHFERYAEQAGIPVRNRRVLAGRLAAATASRAALSSSSRTRRPSARRRS